MYGPPLVGGVLTAALNALVEATAAETLAVWLPEMAINYELKSQHSYFLQTYVKLRKVSLTKVNIY